MLVFTSEQIPAPFLLPEMVGAHSYPISHLSITWKQAQILMCGYFTEFLVFQVERVASMLNYFLLQLVGPQRKSLTLKDPEKYEFRPKQLLKQVNQHLTQKSTFDVQWLFCWL